MKKVILSLLVLTSSLQLASAQAPQKVWESFFNGALSGKDESNFVLSDASGNIYITGTSFQNFSGGNFTTVKYDANGTQMWADHYTNTQASYKNYGKKLVIDKWQNVYAVGTTALHNGDLAICKYNSNGRIWGKYYEPYWFSTYDDYGIDMDVDSSGNIYAIARVNSPSGNLYDLYLMKCDSSGMKSWEVNYSGASDDDYPVAIAATPGGTTYTLLQSFNFFGTATQDITTLQYSTSGGQNWFSKYNGLGSGADYPVSLQVDDAENQYIAGTADVGANNDMVAIKQNLYGTRLWVTTYNGTANENDTAIASYRLPNGFVVVTGKSRELVNNVVLDAMVTMVIDSGTVVWTEKYFGSDNIGAIPTSLKIDSVGNIYICGLERMVGGTSNGCIIKYDVNGNLKWNISYDAGLNRDEKFNELTLDYNNDIIVTGYTSTSIGNSNYLTVKYSNSLTSLTEQTDVQNLNIYPNPARDFFNIVGKGSFNKTREVKIVDLYGRDVKELLINTTDLENSILVDVSELHSGIYLLSIDNKIVNQKVIIEK